MNEVRAESFALADRGIGRLGAARVLAQRLASFCPRQARGADPLLLARAGSMAMNELDLAALDPQVMEEQGAAMPASAMAPHDRSAVPPGPAAAPLLAGVTPLASQTDVLPALAATMADAALAPHMADIKVQAIEPRPQPPLARDEVFALALRASAPPSAPAPASGWGVAGPNAPTATPDSSARQAPAAVEPHAGAFSIEIDPPVPVAAREPRQNAAVLAPPASGTAPARDTPAAAGAPRHIDAPREFPQPVPLRDPPAPAIKTSAPVALPAQREPAQPDVAREITQAATRPAVLPAQPMGPSEAAATPARLPHAVAGNGVLERLAQAARKPADDAVVRIGSVSVVMLPAAPAPAPQHMAVAPPPASMPPPRIHRNPWLGSGRGGE